MKIIKNNNFFVIRYIDIKAYEYFENNLINILIFLGLNKNFMIVKKYIKIIFYEYNQLNKVIFFLKNYIFIQNFIKLDSFFFWTTN